MLKFGKIGAVALAVSCFVLRHPRVFRVLAVLLAIPLIAFLIGSIVYQARVAFYPLDRIEDFRERTLVLDRNGERIGHVYGHGANRMVVTLDEVSPHFVNALLAREDSRFYRHGGVDYIGVARAVVRNIKEKRVAQGASTLTMQLARNSFDLSDHDLDRKFLEVALTRRMEREFSKDEILQYYMNRIYFGSGLYGIERAAEGYFMKPAADLTLAESALLAGIIRGPSRFSPFRDEQAALAQKRETLARMRQLRMISDEELAAAESAELALRPVDQRRASPGYVIQEVYEHLDGFLDEQQVKSGGLRVYTTIDRRLQEAAQASLRGHLAEVEQQDGFPHPAMVPGERQRESAYVQGAVVAIDNATGGILALVGGRDYDDSPFNRAFDAKRQVGSTFKTFVYAQAFSTGLKPGTLVSDGPISMRGGNGRRWEPGNSDGKFGGPTPAAVGLIRSRNTMSIRVGERGGLVPTLQFAHAVGFPGDLLESPVTYLGAFESDPLTLTSAYSIFPNHGIKRDPYFVERIENSEGEILFLRAKPIDPPVVLAPSVAWMTSDVLAKVMDEGTGRGARNLGYEAPCYGKTGTTDEFRDAWFAGYTDKITCGVWVGMDRPRTIVYKGYGSTLALPIWTGVMKAAEETEFAAAPLESPAPLVETMLCRECGLLESRRSVDPYLYALPRDLVPTSACTGHLGRSLAGGRGEEANPIRSIGRLLFGRKKKD